MAAIHAVAVPLSSSLGQPKTAAAPADQALVIAELRQGVLAEQQRAEQWKAFAKKHAGKPIEGTGLNLAGPAGLLALAGIAAACIAFPAFGYLLLRVVPILWGYFTQTTAAIGGFVAERKDAGEDLKLKLSRKMDGAQKRLVRLRYARPPGVNPA